MSQLRQSILQRALVVAGLFVLPLAAGATVWQVPDDPGASTIAEALASAAPGDEIVIAPGTYYEHDLVVPNGVWVIGDSWDGTGVVIDAQGQGRVIAVLDADAANVGIRNLTLTGGDAVMGGGAYVAGADVHFVQMRIVGNQAAYGGGVYSDGDHTEMVGCVIADNSSLTHGGGVYLQGTGNYLILSACLLAQNSATGAAGWYAAAGAYLEVRYSTVADNWAEVAGNEGGAFAAEYVEQGYNAIMSDFPVNLPGAATKNSRELSADYFLVFDADSEPVYECTVRAVGWPGALADQEGVDGNVEAYPLFCRSGVPLDSPADYYGVAAASPCLPENSSAGCEFLIGAYDQACLVPTGAPPATGIGTCVLHRPAPNPFNPATTLSFATRQSGLVRLDIFDLAGRKIATLVNEDLPAGSHEAVWRGQDDRGRTMASGVYLCRLLADRTSASQTLTLIK